MSDIYKYDKDEILSPDEEVIHDQHKMIERLQAQLNYALEVMGQIAMYSDNKVDALQCANAIIVIKDWGKNDRR